MVRDQGILRFRNSLCNHNDIAILNQKTRIAVGAALASALHQVRHKKSTTTLGLLYHGSRRVLQSNSQHNFAKVVAGFHHAMRRRCIGQIKHGMNDWAQCAISQRGQKIALDLARERNFVG